MKSNCLVTVIVCSYNAVKTIERTIESIANQNYEPIELIVIDDGSGDDSVKIAENLIQNKFKNHFESYQIISNTSRLGTVSSIKKSIHAASGKWVKPIAGDDVLLDNCISLFVQLMEKYDADIGVSGVKIIDEFDSEIKTTRPPYELTSTFLMMPKWWQLQYLSLKNILPAPSIFARREIATNIYQQIDQKIIEDWPFWMEAIKGNRKILHINQNLVGYRKHSAQTTNTNHGEIYNEIQNDLKLFSNKYSNFRLRFVRITDNLINTLLRRNQLNPPGTGILYHAIIKFIAHMTGSQRKVGHITTNFKKSRRHE